jgi:hypothetical protein
MKTEKEIREKLEGYLVEIDRCRELNEEGDAETLISIAEELKWVLDIEIPLNY